MRRDWKFLILAMAVALGFTPAAHADAAPCLPPACQISAGTTGTGIGVGGRDNEGKGSHVPRSHPGPTKVLERAFVPACDGNSPSSDETSCPAAALSCPRPRIRYWSWIRWIDARTMRPLSPWI